MLKQTWTWWSIIQDRGKAPETETTTEILSWEHEQRRVGIARCGKLAEISEQVS